MPRAPRSDRVVSDAFKPYRPKDTAASSAKESPTWQKEKVSVSPTPYEMEPELREWLRTQVRILAYWDSLPESHFVPAMPPATRARDAIILSALRRLLA